MSIMAISKRTYERVCYELLRAKHDESHDYYDVGVNTIWGSQEVPSQ